MGDMQFTTWSLIVSIFLISICFIEFMWGLKFETPDLEMCLTHIPETACVIKDYNVWKLRENRCWSFPYVIKDYNIKILAHQRVFKNSFYRIH